MRGGQEAAGESVQEELVYQVDYQERDAGSGCQLRVTGLQPAVSVQTRMTYAKSRSHWEPGRVEQLQARWEEVELGAETPGL